MAKGAYPAENPIDRSIAHLEDSEGFLEDGQVEMAIQAVWNSMEEAVKAVAASRGLNLRSEASVWNYAGALAEDAGDRSPVAIAFRSASLLYADSDSYELTMGDLIAVHGNITAGIRDLLHRASPGRPR